MDIQTKQKYVIDNLDKLVLWLFQHYGDKLIAPNKAVKLHKGLFLLYADLTHNANKSDDFHNNVEAFPVIFEAWSYGPVVPEVLDKVKSDYYNQCKTMELELTTLSKYESSIKNAVINMFDSILEHSDFALVDHTTDYPSWKTAFEEGKDGKDCTMNNQMIVKDYANYLLEKEQL